MNAARLPGNRRLAALALVALALTALALGLALGGGGEGDPGPPRQATWKLVPANALAALTLSTDRDRRAVRRAAALAGRLPSWPGLRRSLLDRLDEPGCGLDMGEDPGREVTFALLPGRGGTSSPLLLTDAPADGLPDRGGQKCGALVARRISGVVAIGEPASLAAAAAVASGSRRALVDAAVYRQAARGLPDERVLTAWASPAGVRDLLPAAGDLLGALARIADTPTLRGAVAWLQAGGDRARIVVRRIARRGAATPVFRPSLQDRAPADAISYDAAGDLAGGLRSLLVLRGEGAGATLGRLLEAGDGALGRLSRLVRESAFVVAPGPDGPEVTLLARVRDAARARAALRALEPALGGLIGAQSGAAWSDATLGGPARRLDTGTASLAYGLSGTVFALSTPASGVSAALGGGARLGAQPGFRSVIASGRIATTSLVFLDPNQLLRLGVTTGTGLEDALQDVRDDLANVRAIGITAGGTGASSTVELLLSIP